MCCADNAVLECSQPPERDLQPILRRKVEMAVALLKEGKYAGADYIPAELVQAGGETMFYCEDLENGRMAYPMDSRWLLHSLKRAIYSSDRTKELSASSVIRAKSSLTGLKPNPKKTLLKNRLGVKPEGAEKNRNSKWKVPRTSEESYHVFTDFKKAFYRVWHAALWAIMRESISVQI